MSEDLGQALPFVSVVRGEPDEDELAALVAGLASATGTDTAVVASPVSAWSDHARRLLGAGANGPRGDGAWRWSLRG